MPPKALEGRLGGLVLWSGARLARYVMIHLMPTTGADNHTTHGLVSLLCVVGYACMSLRILLFCIDGISYPLPPRLGGYFPPLSVCVCGVSCGTLCCALLCAPGRVKVVAADEKEAGLRATLNLGHTFGHAIEVNYLVYIHI